MGEIAKGLPAALGAYPLGESKVLKQPTLFSVCSHMSKLQWHEGGTYKQL